MAPPQLVVNAVMSTDIADKELKELRNNRWDKAFKKGECAGHVDTNPRDEVNRKATIVIEHSKCSPSNYLLNLRCDVYTGLSSKTCFFSFAVIQASDISHTMQHWHVYRKWNQKLFEELYVAYLNGRMEKSPEEFWYKGEFGVYHGVGLLALVRVFC